MSAHDPLTSFRRNLFSKLGPESIVSQNASAALSLIGPTPECMGESVFRSGRGKRLRGSHPTRPTAPAHAQSDGEERLAPLPVNDPCSGPRRQNSALRPSRCDAPVMTPTRKQAVTRLFMRNGCFPVGTNRAS